MRLARTIRGLGNKKRVSSSFVNRCVANSYSDCAGRNRELDEECGAVIQIADCLDGAAILGR